MGLALPEGKAIMADGIVTAAENPAIRQRRRAPKWLRDCLPNRASDEWALVTRQAHGAVYPIRTLIQVVGGPRWSLSLIRLGHPAREVEWRNQPDRNHQSGQGAAIAGDFVVAPVGGSRRAVKLFHGPCAADVLVTEVEHLDTLIHAAARHECGAERSGEGDA